jgi:hypothetical protein
MAKEDSAMNRQDLSQLDGIILNLLNLLGRYDHRTGILKYRTWPVMAVHLNQMGLVTPGEHMAWTEQSAAAYYRRHLRAQDGQLMVSGRR